MRILNFFSFLKKQKKLPVVEKTEPLEEKEFVHRKGRLKPSRIARIESVITMNISRKKAIAIAPYVEDIAEDESLMSLVNHYGHIGDVFFVCCKKMSKLEYQYDVLNYYLDKSVLRTNLIYYLFRLRAKDIQFEIWERMMSDERFHNSIYHFFEKAKKDPAYWEKLVVFFHEKNFATVPCSSKLEKYILIEKELFQH